MSKREKQQDEVSFLYWPTLHHIAGAGCVRFSVGMREVSHDIARADAIKIGSFSGTVARAHIHVHVGSGTVISSANNQLGDVIIEAI